MSAARDYQRIEVAIRWLDQQAAGTLDMPSLAAALGLSPAHVRRLFQRWAGVSPLRFLQSLRAIQAQAALRDQATVLDATLALGLSGPGRLHDLLTSVDAVTPGEVRAMGRDLLVRHAEHDTPFGPVFVAVTERGVVQLAFLGEAADAASALAALKVEWPQATHRRDVQGTAHVAARITGLEEAERPLAALVRGTNLQVQVWRALLRIPPGRTVSYRHVGEAVGHPRAVRAVASAIGRNPIACLIPCHRVLRTTGAIGGYRWGTVRKRALLARELSAVAPSEAPSETVAGHRREERPPRPRPA